jgi:hypothetical protein
MPSVSAIYGSGEMLKFEDLNGQTFILRIESTRIQHYEAEEGRPAKDVIIVSFLGAKKELRINATSARRLAEVYGDETDGWVGKDVTLMPRQGSTPNFNTIDVYAAPNGAVPSTGPDGTTPLVAQAPVVQPQAAPAPVASPPSDDSIPF